MIKHLGFALRRWVGVVELSHDSERQSLESTAVGRAA